MLLVSRRIHPCASPASFLVPMIQTAETRLTLNPSRMDMLIPVGFHEGLENIFPSRRGKALLGHPCLEAWI
jgi:hypothetical protein